MHAGQDGEDDFRAKICALLDSGTGAKSGLAAGRTFPGAAYSTVSRPAAINRNLDLESAVAMEVAHAGSRIELLLDPHLVE